VKADFTGTIVRVEEDWEYQALTGESSEVPHVTCSLSTLANHDGHHMTFELNHQSQPGFEAGGLHLNVWQSDSLLGTVHTQNQVVQGATGEVVRWTQSVTLDQGLLTYDVTHGESTTWGAFGNGELTASTYTSLTDLNGYDVEQSVEEFVLATEGISYLMLRNVRLVLSTGEVVEIPINLNVLDVPVTEYNPEPEPGQ
jgi:hypothetical protein